MSTSALDPLIHDPERLRVVATLAALPDGNALALTRLQGRLGSAGPDDTAGPGQPWPDTRGQDRLR
jgi:hypothetical protein